MKKLLRRRPSAAMLVAVIALVAALAGTAVAGGGFLTKKKFKNQAVRGPVTYATSTGAVPDTGFGPAGAHVSASCPTGTHVLGGGIKLANNEHEFVNDSYPTTTGWAGTVNADAAGLTATVTAVCATVKSVTGAPPG
jgi:hypothetical protein